MTFRAIVYPPPARIAAAVLTVISRVSPLVILALLVFFETRLTNQLRLTRTFASVCLAPAIAAWLLRNTFAATAAVENGTLVLRRRTQRIEIPCQAIDRVIPWLLPALGSGVWLRLQSGRRFRYGLELTDPVAFAEALADAGAPEHVRSGARHPAALYARAKNCTARRWDHPLFKYVVFALVPTVPVFRLHQWIAYGGTFGEYYSYGLRAYLLGFAIYWATFTIYLVLYAAALRAATETIAWAAAYAAPSHATRVRRAAEIAHRILYYGGVPALLLRFLLR